MLSRVSERKMLTVRGMLLLAWLALIVSLLWDPFSIDLTRAENSASPFRVTDDRVVVQHQTIGSDPYPMGARIFWTMAVPILPLFLMVFGHEAWRRICPLSFASQIPGFLRLTRRRHRVNRRNGYLDSTVALLEPNGWIGRNTWYVQFGLLFLGISARLLLINSDRYALAFALLGVILAAVLTGLLWGGKTWCNYFCPANVVQKIYTEPRGLLESAPHLARPALPQSMCRKPTRKGEQSACVACMNNCGDIDLERAYWQGVQNPQRANTYYMFFGLILGFYGYYYLYSGNWDYYFSGIWTHEAGLRDRLMGPGFFLLGQSIPIPKLVAAPLTLALACLASLGLGKLLEALYRRFRRRQGHRIDEATIIHHCLSVSAWASINAFYLFGGRPNLALLPQWGTNAVDLMIVTLTTLWLHHVLQTSPSRYERESMRSRLLGQLRAAKVDVSRFLEGRRLDDLKPDEIYLLGKVLPGVSRDHKLQAYRNVLNQSVAEGGTASAVTVRMLQDLRTEMDITETEHTEILEALGVTAEAEVEVTEEERAASLASYREMLAGLVGSRVTSGRLMDDILGDPEFQQTVRILRASLQISETEHLSALAELAAADGVLGRRMHEILDQLVAQQAVRFFMEAADIADPLGSELIDLIVEHLKQQESAICVQALSFLQTFGGGPAGESHAQALIAIAGPDLLASTDAPGDGAGTHAWSEALEPSILRILRGEGEAPRQQPQRSYREALTASLDEKANLDRLLQDEDPLMRAIALAIFGYTSPILAQKAAERVAASLQADDHPMLRDVVERLAGVDFGDAEPAGSDALTITLAMPGMPETVTNHTKTHLTIGRGFDNDIVIEHETVWTYHAEIWSENAAVKIRRLDGGALAVDGQPVASETALRNHSAVSLGAPGSGAPRVTVGWKPEAFADNQMQVAPLHRLAMLRRCGALRRLPLGTLAGIAADATVLRYPAHARLLAPTARGACYVVHFGTLRLFDPEIMKFAENRRFVAGDIIDSELTTPQATLVPEIQSDFAILLRLQHSPELSLPTAPPEAARRRAAASRGPTMRQDAHDATAIDAI